MNNYKYALGEDENNKCINIPRYRAGGRVAPDGKRYPTREVKADETNLVPVRSIITKFTNKDIVTPDCIGTQYTDLTPDTALGTAFGTSLTESITQGALGLKHGGHERVIAEEGYLIAPKDCTVSEEGKFLILKGKSGKDLKYPRPSNIVLSVKESFSKGDIVATAYNTTSPVIRLNSLINLMRASGGRALRYYEKDNIISSECYAYESGKISYTLDKNGEVVVTIGNIRYSYNPNCMYYYPEGTEIKKFQRICSGVVDMSRVISYFNTNIQDVYTIFRDQFYVLCENGFVKSRELSPNAVQEELCEMLFISLINVDYNPTTDKIHGMEYLGTNRGIMNNNSFYTMLSYGYSGRVVTKALTGEAAFKDDVMTSTVLGLLLNNKLD